MYKMLPYLGLLMLLLAGGFAAGWFLHPSTQKIDPLPVLGQVPDYTLTNQLGQRVSSTSFHGKVRVVTFLFTYCRGYCPLIAHSFMTLEQVIKAAGMEDQVQLVAFNVDPEKTGPAEMRAFQLQYGWKPDNQRWEFLTGSSQEIHHIVTDAYHVYYQKVMDNDEESDNDNLDDDSIPEPVVANQLADKAGVGYDIIHNDLLAIVDTQGRIRKFFDNAERVSDEQIMDIIYRLLPTEKTETAKADHIMKTITTDGLRIELHVMPAEPFYTADQVKANPTLEGMLIVGGAKPMVPDAHPHPDYHLIVHVFDARTNQAISDANVSMTYQAEMQGQPVGVETRVPVVVMQVIGKGPETTHYGNNVLLPDGTYAVTVVANGKQAVFHIDVSPRGKGKPDTL